MVKHYSNLPVESDLADEIRQSKKSGETYTETIRRLMGQKNEV